MRRIILHRSSSKSIYMIVALNPFSLRTGLGVLGTWFLARLRHGPENEALDFSIQQTGISVTPFPRPSLYFWIYFGLKSEGGRTRASFSILLSFFFCGCNPLPSYPSQPFRPCSKYPLFVSHSLPPALPQHHEVWRRLGRNRRLHHPQSPEMPGDR